MVLKAVLAVCRSSAENGECGEQTYLTLFPITGQNVWIAVKQDTSCEAQISSIVVSTASCHAGTMQTVFAPESPSTTR